MCGHAAELGGVVAVMGAAEDRRAADGVGVDEGADVTGRRVVVAFEMGRFERAAGAQHGVAERQDGVEGNDADDEMIGRSGRDASLSVRAATPTR
jgi:hypothetical protein